MSLIRSIWFVVMLALCASAPAQTTRPDRATESSFDNQPIRRDAAATREPTVATTAQAQFDSAAGESALRGLEPARVLLALGVVIALIFAMRWIAKRFFPAAAAGKSAGLVRVLARTPLNPRQQVVLLQVGRRVIVVADSGTGLSALAQIKDEDEVASILGQLNMDSVSISAGRFGNIFGKAKEQFVEPESDESDAAPSDLGLAAARGELSGLIEKVRGLAQNVKKS